MYCSSCGEELSEDSKVCKQCGLPTSNSFNVDNRKNKSINGVITKLKTKKGIVWGLIVLFLFVFVLIIAAQFLGDKEKTIEEHLLGEWIAENDNGEASIVFELDGDEYVGNWTIYDYGSKEWDKIDFTIKEIDDYVMTILIDNGDMEFVSFAVSKDTLIFADTEYRNKGKDVPIPTDKYTYILDGVIRPVTMGCYIGMSKAEVSKTIPYSLEPYITDVYRCELPEEEYGDIDLQLYFDDEYGLDRISYRLGDGYYDNKSGIIDFLSDMYGEYAEEQSSIFDSIYTYTWHSGNLVIMLNEYTDDNSLRIEYSIDFDWFLEFRRNHK